MTNELKEKIRKSMMELLISKGYPNISNNMIIQMLPDLYKKLETEGLLEDLRARNFNYKQFVDIALQAQARAEAMEAMNSFFRRGQR